jgi:hypothetical protein
MHVILYNRTPSGSLMVQQGDCRGGLNALMCLIREGLFHQNTLPFLVPPIRDRKRLTTISASMTIAPDPNKTESQEENKPILTEVFNVVAKLKAPSPGTLQGDLKRDAEAGMGFQPEDGGLGPTSVLLGSGAIVMLALIRRLELRHDVEHFRQDRLVLLLRLMSCVPRNAGRGGTDSPWISCT